MPLRSQQHRARDPGPTRSPPPPADRVGTLYAAAVAKDVAKSCVAPPPPITIAPPQLAELVQCDAFAAWIDRNMYAAPPPITIAPQLAELVKGNDFAAWIDRNANALREYLTPAIGARVWRIWKDPRDTWCGVPKEQGIRDAAAKYAAKWHATATKAAGGDCWTVTVSEKVLGMDGSIAARDHRAVFYLLERWFAAVLRFAPIPPPDCDGYRKLAWRAMEEVARRRYVKVHVSEKEVWVAEPSKTGAHRHLDPVCLLTELPAKMAKELEDPALAAHPDVFAIDDVRFPSADCLLHMCPTRVTEIYIGAGSAMRLDTGDYMYVHSFYWERPICATAPCYGWEIEIGDRHCSVADFFALWTDPAMRDDATHLERYPRNCPRNCTDGVCWAENNLRRILLKYRIGDIVQPHETVIKDR